MQSSNLNTQSGLLSGETRPDLPWRLHVCQLLWGLSGCRSSLELFWSRMIESHSRYLACRVSHAVLLLPPLLLLWSCLLPTVCCTVTSCALCSRQTPFSSQESPGLQFPTYCLPSGCLSLYSRSFPSLSMFGCSHNEVSNFPSWTSGVSLSNHSTYLSKCVIRLPQRKYRNSLCADVLQGQWVLKMRTRQTGRKKIKNEMPVDCVVSEKFWNLEKVNPNNSKYCWPQALFPDIEGWAHNVQMSLPQKQ